MLNQSQQFLERIRKSEKILIVFNKNWSGDAVASALALYHFLKKTGKQAEILAEANQAGQVYRFLPGFDQIQNRPADGRDLVVSVKLEDSEIAQVRHQLLADKLELRITPVRGSIKPEDVSAKIGAFPYDLIISVDSRDLESLGQVYEDNPELFYHAPIINIDNHPANEEFGQINLIELTAVSTTEILFNLFNELDRQMIDEDLATCLLTGIIAKTRSFKTSNVTPAALTTVAQLISLGGRRDEIINQLYRSRNLSVLKLWGVTLARLKSTLEHSLVWSLVTAEDFKKTGTTPTDLAEVVEELIVNIPQAKAIALLYEEPGAEKMASSIQLYAIKNLNALALLKEFSPNGNKYLAHCRMEQSLQKLEEITIANLTEKLKALPLD
ncbi:hypothetical protein HGA34_05315 [Candidatus Falkowbacteria bacterium]|nr:hypothetical protein [Candidatus Falkowbacteria bacterium]